MNFPDFNNALGRFVIGCLSIRSRMNSQHCRRMILTCFGALLITGSIPAPAVAQQMLTGRADVEAFLDDMASRYQLDRKILGTEFAGLTIDPTVLRLMQPVAPGKRSWDVYRTNHLDRLRILKGRQFLVDHQSKLKAAEQKFGVPAEVITAILGIETNYGADKGTFPVLRSLSTLTFGFPEWADEFRPQLVDLLLLAREQGKQPNSYVGSFAGAMGYPQFMPSAWRSFGIDGDGDGKVDLIASVDDAIFSVGHYLQRHGWTPGRLVALRVRIPSQKALELRAAPNSDKPGLRLAQLIEANAQPVTGTLIDEPAILVDLPTPEKPTEYWLGYQNFYALMQYNRSFFYAMAVFQLSQSLAAN